MADNLAITEGSGTTIGTDDVGGVHYQKVKIFDPTADSSDAIATDQGYSSQRVLRVVHATDVGVSTNATQSGTWNIGTVTTVTGVTNSLAANIVDSSGVAYTTTNPVPVGDAGGSLTIDGSVSVSGAISSVVATGTVVSDVADDGSAPLKQGGIARTANPTAVSGGDTVSFSADDLGRQLVRPVQVRDLIQTAYVAISNGTETTLVTAPASTFLDLIYVVGANNSDAGVVLDIRPGTANGIVLSLSIPPYGTAGVSLSVPIPQEAVAASWTVDMPDITGTTVDVSALFTKEV